MRQRDGKSEEFFKSDFDRIKHQTIIPKVRHPTRKCEKGAVPSGAKGHEEKENGENEMNPPPLSPVQGKSHKNDKAERKEHKKRPERNEGIGSRLFKEKIHKNFKHIRAFFLLQGRFNRHIHATDSYKRPSLRARCK